MLAGVPVAFTHEGRRAADFFAAFRTEVPPILTVSVTPEEIENEYRAERPSADRAALGADRGYGEALALYRRFCHALPALGGFFLHAGFFTYRGHGIALLANSGVGKSTHIARWRELCGSEVRVINGDKPLVRRVEGRFLGYGAPLSGKEGWCEHTEAPITELILLARGERDTVTPVTAADAFPTLFSSVLAPEGEAELACLLPLLSELLSTVRVYRATVTKELSAAIAVRRAICED